MTTVMRVHLTEETALRTLITNGTASAVSVRVVRGYGLELALFETGSLTSLAKATYRDLNPARVVAVLGTMRGLAYTLKRRHDVSKPFDVEVTYHDGALPTATS